MSLSPVPAGTVLVAGAEIGHAAAIAALHAALFERPWSEAEIAAMLGRPEILGLVAVQHGAAAMHGFVLAQIVLDEAEILSIGVARERQGLGGVLLEELTRHAAAAGVRRLHLEVAATNAAALALYAKHGFRETGRRKGYYPARDGRADALLLSAAIG